MLRLRVEAPPAAWRGFRASMYLFLLAVLPLEVAGVVGADSGFGRALLVVLPFSWAIAVFGVEFTTHAGRQPQTVVLDAEAVRFSGGGAPPWTVPWSRVREVHARIGGRGHGPEWVTFRIRSARSSRLIRLTLPEDGPVAERIAGTMARRGPSLRITGNAEGLRWGTELAGEGDETVRLAGPGPRFFRSVAIVGPAAGLGLLSAGFLTGVVSRGTSGVLATASYLLLGLAQVGFNERMARTAPRGPREPARKDFPVAFLAAAAIVIAEGIVGIWFLVAP